MPRFEERICPACGLTCSPLLRACPACKHTFVSGADTAAAAPPAIDAAPDPAAGRPRVALKKPGAASAPPAAALPPGPSPPAQSEPVRLVKPSHGREPSRPAVPPVTPSPPARGVTVPMSPHEAALAVAGSAAQKAAAKGRVPATAPQAPVSPGLAPLTPRVDSRRSGGGKGALFGGLAAVVIGVVTVVVWSASGNGNDPEYKPLPLPSPSATVLQDPAPPSDTPPVPAPSSRPTSPGSAAPSKREEADGWIPAEAMEAVTTASLHAEPDTDPLCTAPASPIQIGKAFGVELEKELREATKVTDEEESRIGKRLETALPRDRSFAGKWDLPADVARYGRYLNDLIAHIARGRSRRGIDYRVHVVRRPEFNAGALPGGVLMINTGALEGSDAVHDEAELVAVLGHEIAHVEKRHTIAAYQYAKALFGEDADAAIAMKILTTPISSQYEMEADDDGLRLAVEAQYDPQGAVDLWRRMARKERPASGGILGEALDDLLRSHPRAPVRACNAMKKVLWAHDAARWTRLYDGRTNLQSLVIGPKKAY